MSERAQIDFVENFKFCFYQLRNAGGCNRDLDFFGNYFKIKKLDLLDNSLNFTKSVTFNR